MLLSDVHLDAGLCGGEVMAAAYLLCIVLYHVTVSRASRGDACSSLNLGKQEENSIFISLTGVRQALHMWILTLVQLLIGNQYNFAHFTLHSMQSLRLHLSKWPSPM